MILTAVEIRDAVAMALSALKANKMRAGLTILGVFIGVASVISMASVINGLDVAVESEIDNLGSNLIFITRLPMDTDRHSLSDEDRNRPPITTAIDRFMWWR